MSQCESRLLGAQCSDHAGHPGPHGAYVLWETDDPGVSQPTEDGDTAWAARHTGLRDELPIGMAKPTARYDVSGRFIGHEPRECGEHRTVGAHRAWCFDCQEWCYPHAPCVRCEIIGLRKRAAAHEPLQTEDGDTDAGVTH